MAIQVLKKKTSFCYYRQIALFTDLALCAGSVIELPCPFVCMCVTKVVIVDCLLSTVYNLLSTVYCLPSSAKSEV